MDAATALALIGAGIAAGALNTLAGGGSLIFVPALMLSGMDGTVANASSRVAIFMQCVAGAAAFARGGHLPTAAARSIVPPVLVGAAAGAYVATQISNRIYTPLLLGTLALMALALIINPRRFAPPSDATPRAVRGAPAILGLVAAGFYGGVLQAGAGFVFLAILAAGLRYDLVRANALKALVMLIYVALTAGVFIAYGMVRWAPALVLGAGAIVGAIAAARLAMTPRGAALTKGVVVIAVLALLVVMITRL
ncbi:MAG: sulfite exporter TauE/SafE family protein [Myxococcales bacterium]|nr:sulfite exporter TauE/SafE family protein [Myxococcales bacterium]